ncbi:class I poly(R)-hydroxyalkanoic acid synthase [Paracoccus onchidii]
MQSARKLGENIERIEALGHRLVAAFREKAMPNPGVEGPGPDLVLTAANAWMKTLAEQPTRLIEQQVNYWGETLQNYSAAQRALTGMQGPADDGQPITDKRFKNPLWQTHPYFSYVRKQYLTNVRAFQDTMDELDLPDQVARRRVDWLTRQIVDMMSPTNFLATNPDALERAVETEGESLVRGLENLVRDVELNGGEMVVSLADREAFTVGENIGTAEGSVVYQTSLFELIQYKPTTDQVHATPMLIFPPWINKFYILDLKPQNSLIRWLVGQGHSLFVVSWKNPDAAYAEIGIDDYIAAYLDAMDKVRELTEQPKLNVVGYCIAGTTLSLTLALLNKLGDERVNSATLLTTLTDFSDHGEFTAYLHDDFVNGIVEEVERHGLMRAQLMSRTMSFLRANDLVWGPAIRSYMLGETPPAFDLLYWNGDSTNLPGRMALQYLRGLCQRNEFAGQGFEVMGRRVHLGDVATPLCAVACETDHIAPWSDCWRGVAAMGSADKTFILSESGHIAGIVNPPTKMKYGHYADGDGFDRGHDHWRESSTFTEGSWWPRWGDWLADRAGAMVPAREISGEISPAPGSYVHERAV